MVAPKFSLGNRRIRMNRLCFLLVVVLLALALVAQGAVVPASTVYFTASKDKEKPTKCDIFSMGLDGKNLRDWNISVSNISHVYPAPDKSGRILVSLVTADTGLVKDFICVYGKDGKEIRRIPRIVEEDMEASFDTHYSWSPDGKDILYATMGDKNESSIWRLNPVTGKRTCLLHTPVRHLLFNPTMSPSATKLAFAYVIYDENATKAEDKQSSLYRHYVATVPVQASVIDMRKSKHLTPLPSPATNVINMKINYLQMTRFLEWSKDGKRLGFFSPKQVMGIFDTEEERNFVKSLDDPTLYVYDFTEKRLYKKAPKEAGDPFVDIPYIIDAAFSPDGKKYAFLAIGGLWLWNVGDEKAVKLVDTLEAKERGLDAPAGMGGYGLLGIPKFWGSVQNLCWTPDSKTILLNTSCQIFTVDLVKKEPKEIFKNTEIYIQNVTVQ
jgi:Tol biopolymer transport system component